MMVVRSGETQVRQMRPLEFGWYLPTHGDTTAYGLAEAQIAGSPELCERVVAGRREGGLRISADPGRLDLLGSLDLRRVHGGAFGHHQAADRGAAGLYQSGADGEDDLDLRPDVGRAHLHQFDRGPERERGRGRRRAPPQGRALRADGGGSLDPQGAVDHAGPGSFPGQVPHAVRRACPAETAAKAVSEILSRRRLAAGLGDVGETFRRASVLGRPAREDRAEHRRDQAIGARARPRERDRLRHAAADHLPRGREATRGRPPTSWCGTPPSG